MNDLIFLSAVSMAEKIRKKEISPVELVDAHLAQIEKLNPKLNAFIQVDSEMARQASRDAEAAIRQGKTIGPLHGVPISIKSSISVRGLAMGGRNPSAQRIGRATRCSAGLRA